jgi:hypothetical protein
MVCYKSTIPDLGQEVHVVKEPHGFLEQTHWTAGKSRFTMKSISKSWFLMKIWF